MAKTKIRNFSDYTFHSTRRHIDKIGIDKIGIEMKNFMRQERVILWLDEYNAEQVFDHLKIWLAEKNKDE